MLGFQNFAFVSGWFALRCVGKGTLLLFEIGVHTRSHLLESRVLTIDHTR